MSVPAIDRLLRTLVAQGASDLHLGAGMPALMRKDGDIQPLAADSPPLEAAEVAALLRDPQSLPLLHAEADLE